MTNRYLCRRRRDSLTHRRSEEHLEVGRCLVNQVGLSVVNRITVGYTTLEDLLAAEHGQ